MLLDLGLPDFLPVLLEGLPRAFQLPGGRLLLRRAFVVGFGRKRGNPFLPSLDIGF
jgi:hypothetical protein